MSKTNKFNLDYCISKIEAEYARWKHLYEKGGSDPFWCDGCNLNLVRNHIIYYKKDMESNLKGSFWLYPDIYYTPLPPTISNNFVAVDRVINGVSYQSEKDKLSYLEIMAQSF